MVHPVKAYFGYRITSVIGQLPRGGHGFEHPSGANGEYYRHYSQVELDAHTQSSLGHSATHITVRTSLEDGSIERVAYEHRIGELSVVQEDSSLGQATVGSLHRTLRTLKMAVPKTEITQQPAIAC